MQKMFGFVLIVMTTLLFTGCGSDESLKNSLRQANEHPTDWTAWLNLSKAYEDRGNYAEAIRAMEKIIPLKPEEPGVYERLASLYVFSDEFDKAIQTANKAVSLAEKVGPEAVQSANLLRDGIKLYVQASPNERKALRAKMK